MHYKAGIIPVAVRIISTWLLRLFFLAFFFIFLLLKGSRSVTGFCARAWQSRQVVI